MNSIDDISYKSIALFWFILICFFSCVGYKVYSEKPVEYGGPEKYDYRFEYEDEDK
jgi:hypothetical protein